MLAGRTSLMSGVPVVLASDTRGQNLLVVVHLSVQGCGALPGGILGGFEGRGFGSPEEAWRRSPRRGWERGGTWPDGHRR